METNTGKNYRGVYYKAGQHSQALFVWAGSTEPKAPVRDNEDDDGGYHIYHIFLC